MGVVYRAHDALLEREVALKIISATIEGNTDLRERFFREARAAGQLSHRNVITIHDLGEHEGQPYLAMEFLKGEDLQHRLTGRDPMSLTRKLEIASEICDGLAYAHRRGLIHRDIKPANIFITDEGVVKILDFGLARMVTSELTASNMMLGTLNYMAPEQIRGERIDHRADIFSFGVVLYEILSGRKAFQGDSFATTLYKILQDVPEPLLNIDATLPVRGRQAGGEGDREGPRRSVPGPQRALARSGASAAAPRDVRCADDRHVGASRAFRSAASVRAETSRLGPIEAAVRRSGGADSSGCPNRNDSAAGPGTAIEGSSDRRGCADSRGRRRTGALADRTGREGPSTGRRRDLCSARPGSRNAANHGAGASGVRPSGAGRGSG